MSYFEVIEDDDPLFLTPTGTYVVSANLQEVVKEETGLYYYKARGLSEYPLTENGWATQWSEIESIQLDQDPPTNPIILIDEPELISYSTVTLLLGADDAIQMIIAEDSSFTGVQWEPYNTTKEFAFTGGDGQKSVYVKYRDFLNNETDPISDSVMIDQTDPIVRISNPPDGSVTHEESITIEGEVNEVCQEVFVNGVLAQLDNTLFSADVSLPAGNNEIIATATDVVGNSGESQPITVTYESSFSKASSSAEEVWRINCGSNADYSDSSQNWWMRDEAFFSLWRWGYTGGYASSTPETITGTDLQAVYRTNRYGDMSYKIDLPSGEYEVTLLFAETYWEEPGSRVFDVAIEGTTLWSDVDVFSLAGGKNSAFNLTTQITITDGNIVISFPAVSADEPMLSGIIVKAVSVTDRAFLDFIQLKMFWFFWNDVDPDTKLVKWGRNNWGDDFGVVGSLPSNGFALSIYTIGVERGWVAREEAYQRVMAILNAFDALVEQVNGFWYHYFDIRTGVRADMSEVSTVDSALFIMGALQAGEYFKDTHPDVKQKADELYERMDWSWFTGIPPMEEFISMGWKPENDGYSYIIPTGKPEGGFYCADWWNRFCESVFVDLMALGSPTYPISPNAWMNMNRGWVSSHGYEFIDEPPLFTQQFHHLYFDMRDKRDLFTDYFLNSQKATLNNRQTCLEDPLSQYEENRWGLSACGAPTERGYEAYGAQPNGWHDGTVALHSAITSIMFTQDESIDAARFMFFQYKHHIWGLHGFCDSFNVDLAYRDWSMNGLDNGTILIAIENHRNELIWNTFMQSSYPQLGIAFAGFYNTPHVSESSFENVGFEGSNAVDGNLLTRWSSTFSDTPQWIELDFKNQRVFNKITLEWEDAYAEKYKLQISDNRCVWTDIFEMGNGDGGSDVIQSNDVAARYVRMYGLQRATIWGYSIWEMTVEYDGSLAHEKTVYASSNEWSAPEALDGNLLTRWLSQSSDPQWITIDFETPTFISKVILNWETAYGKSYKIQISDDNINWIDVFETTEGDGGIDEITFSPTSIRYLRLYGTERGTIWGYSLWEIIVLNE
ncbi:discoidin domain-containing protein [Chlamydiota bacterium]